MKIVYKARDITEAHIVAGLLHSQDIDNHVTGYYLQGAVGDLGAFDFANVQVQDKDFEAAREVVAEYERGRYEGQLQQDEGGGELEPEATTVPGGGYGLTKLAANTVWFAALAFSVVILFVYLLLT